MKQKGWYEVGEQIRDMVQSAVESGDFSQLNESISSTVSKTVNTAVNGVRKAHYGDHSTKKESYDTIRYARSPKGRISGPVMAVVGFLFAGIFLLLTLLALLASAFFGELESIISTVILAVLGLAGIVTGLLGVSSFCRYRRFKRYVAGIGAKGYCSLQELCCAVGKPKSFVVRDLKKMIQKGMFLQGHLDKQQTCLIVTEQDYEQYLKTQYELERRQAAEAKQRQLFENPQLDARCRKILEEGQGYVRRIREANDAIDDPVMSEKLARLEEIMSKIFAQVAKDPEIADEMHKFMNYYLPTTTKLVNAYRELDEQPMAGQNIAGTRREIEDTLDTINEAFGNLLDRFFRDRAWDISADITVMKSMLAQEGLMQTGFEKSEQKKGS